MGRVFFDVEDGKKVGCRRREEAAMEEVWEAGPHGSPDESDRKQRKKKEKERSVFFLVCFFLRMRQ